MFSKIAILATVSLALSVAAAPHDGRSQHGGGPQDSGVSQCNTKDLYCCSDKTDVNTTAGGLIVSLLGPNGKGLTGLLGSGCSSINILAIQSNGCSNQPVCCSGNQQTNSGLIVFNCSPVNVNV